MIVRALDTNNDWTYGRGKNDYLSANRAIGQSIQTRISSFLGDCFWSITSGIDWFGYLGSKDQIGLNLAISATIANTPGVIKIIQLSVDLDSARRLTIHYEVDTIYTGILSPSTITSTTNFLLTEGGSIITTEGGDPITV